MNEDPCPNTDVSEFLNGETVRIVLSVHTQPHWAHHGMLERQWSMPISQQLVCCQTALQRTTQSQVSSGVNDCAAIQNRQPLIQYP